MGCTFPPVAQGAAHQHAMTALLVCLADAALLGQPQGSALSCPALPYFQVVQGPRGPSQADESCLQARSAGQAQAAADQGTVWS
jgi:hypothetical protein